MEEGAFAKDVCMTDSSEVIAVSTDNGVSYIRRSVFQNLFENSHIYYKKEYQDALRDKRVRLKVLQKLAREAQIPYSLFFASDKMVQEQIERNNTELFKGVDNGIFSMSGRGNVDIRDINLIIKDIIKRQKILTKEYPQTPENDLCNLLRGSRDDISDQAKTLSETIGFDLNKFRSFSQKERAYDYLVALLESNNILVSRSRVGAMPQSVNRNVSFSGIVVKNKRFPSIFLYTKDETRVGDPTGRRIFTLFLLLVCVAKGKYTPVSYSSRSKEIIDTDEYKIVEQILMPRQEYEGSMIDDVSGVKNIADYCKITPRAALVCLRRLECIDSNSYDSVYDQLDVEYTRGKEGPGHPWTASSTTKVKTYCGIEFTKKAFELYDTGKLSRGDLRRILLFNKKPKSFLDDLRQGL